MSTENELEISGLGTPAGFVDTLGRMPDVLGVLDGMPESVDGLGVSVISAASRRDGSLSSVRIDTIASAPVLVFSASFSSSRAAAIPRVATVQQSETVAAPAAVPVPGDISAPDAPAINPVAALANVATFVLSGVAEAGSTVRIAVDGSQAGAVVTRGDGTWSLGLALADGSHSITASAMDAAGNVSAVSRPVQLTVDTSAPSIPEIVSMADDAGQPRFSGVAEPGSTVTVYLNGAAIGAVTAGDGGSWTFVPASAIGDGGHVLAVAAADQAGNISGLSAGLGFVIDTIPPFAAEVTGISAAGIVQDGGITGANALVIGGSAEAGSSVEVFIDGVSIGSIPADANGKWLIDHSSTALPDGSYTVTARATDGAGNIGPMSPAFALTVDTVAPAEAAVTGITGEPALVTGGVIKNNALVIAGGAEAFSTVEILIDGALIGSTVADSAGNWVFDHSGSALGDGSHIIASRATDSAGNVGPVSKEFAILVDTAAPAAAAVTGIAGDTAAPGDGITRNRDLVINGTAEAGSTVEVFINAVRVGTAVAGTAGNWTFDNSGNGLTDGSYTVSARATDVAGNIGSLSESYTVVIDTTSPEAAVITGVSGGKTVSREALDGFSAPLGNVTAGAVAVSGDTVTGDNTPTITGIAEQGSTVEVFIDGALIGSALANAAGTWKFDYTGAVLGDGTYAITARATDAAGNIGPFSAAFSATIDTDAPPAATVTGIVGDSGIPGDGITNDRTLIISGQAEAYSSVEVFLNGKTIGSVTTNAFGVWSLDRTTAPQADGRYVLTARATDEAGNTGAFSPDYALTVDSSSPRPPTISGISNDTGNATDRITADNTLLISGRAEKDTTVEVFINGQLIGSTTADAGGLWTLDHSATVIPDGAYTITSRAIDVAGNIGTLSSGFAFTVDTSSPLAPTVTGISGDSAMAGDGITSDNTLIISGTAEKNSTVEVFLDGASIGTTLANALGVWSLNRTANPLADGAYAVTARATDVAGNIGSLSSPFSFTVDTLAPQAAVITGVSSDTGTPADGITADRTLVFDGRAEAGSSVEVFLNGASIGAVTANAHGFWVLDRTANPLFDGSYTLTARATDAAGNVGPMSPGYAFSVDTVVPGAAVVTGVAGDTSVANDGITSDRTLVISGLAEKGASVAVFLNGISAGTVTSDNSGRWSFDNTAVALTDGSYVVTARAIDAAGNEGPLSAPYAVTIDTTDPAAATITGISGDTGIPSDGITGANALTISGTAEVGSTVEVFLNGVSAGTVLATSSGVWTLDHTGTILPDGSYAVTARATDKAGNVGSFSAPYALSVDTLAPPAAAVTGISNDTAGSSDGVTSDNGLVLQGTAEAGSTVKVFLSGILLDTVQANPNGVWTLDRTAHPLADGDYTITARATDAAGNEGPLSGGYALTVDTVAPLAATVTGVSSDTSTAHDGITSDNSLVISGTAEAGSDVEVFLNGHSAGTTKADTSGHWSLNNTQASLPDGTYAVTARANDKAGNAGVLSVPYALIVDTTEPVPAIVTSITTDTGHPADGITSDSTLTISGSAEAGSSVEVFLNDVSAGNVQVGTSGFWMLDHTASALPDGVYAVTARATDKAGNVGSLSAPYALTIDTASPQAGSVTGISSDTGIPGDSITSDNTLIINGTAEAGSSVEILLNGGTAGIVTADASGLWALDLTAHTLPDGTYTITTRATDAAGNVGPLSAGYAFTIDTAAPAAPAVTGISSDTSVANDGVTSDSTLVIGGTALRNSTVEIYLNNQKVGSTEADALGGWSFDHREVSLANGSYSVTARVLNGAGIASAFSAPYTLTVDAAAPNAPTVDRLPIITDSGSILLTGTAEAGSAVTVYVDGSQLGTVAAGQNGIWSLQVTVQEGEHQVTATAADLAGNVSPTSSATSFTVDLTTPAQPDWLDGGTVAEDAAIGTVVGMVAARDDRAAVVTYELLDNANGRFAIDAATGVVTVRNNSLNVHSPDTLDWDQGHAITVRATDAAGNFQTSTLHVGVENSEIPEYLSEIAFIDAGLSDIAGLAAGIRPGIEVHIIPAGTDGLDFIAGVLAGRQGVDAIHILSHGDTGSVQLGNYTLDAGNVAARLGVLTGIGSALAAGGDILLYGCDTTSDGGALLSALAGATGADVAGSIDLTGSSLLGGDWRLESSTGQIEAGGAVTSEGREAYASTLPGTALQAGDIAIIQMSSDGYDDFIRFVPLVDLAAGTVIKFSDRSLLTGGTYSGDASEGNETWTLSAPISAGTVLFFDPYYGVTYTFAGNNIAQGTNSWDTGLDVISPEGENFFIYTGGSGNLFDTNPTGFIWGVNAPGYPDAMDANGWAISNLDTTNSILPTGLTPGVNAMSMYDGGSEARNNFNYTGPTSATDKAGWAARFANPANFSHSDGVAPGSTISGTITVTASLPKTATPTITLDPSSDTGSSNSDRETSASTVILRGTAEANSTVTVSMGGVVQGTATANGSGNWSFTTSAGTPLSDGVKSFTATATGTSGVASDPTSALLVTIDRTAPNAPTISLDAASDTGTSNSDRIINDNTPTIRGTAEALSTVAIFSNLTKIGETTADGSGNWSFTTPTLGDGSRVLGVQATDKAGNTGAFSPALALTVDTVVTPPTLNSTNNIGTSYTFNGQGEAGATVTLSLNGVPTVPTAVVAGNGTWTLAITLPEGNQNVQFRQEDVAGNVSSSTATVPLTVSSGPPAAPTVTLQASDDTGATSSDGVTSDTQPVLTGTAEANATVTIFLDGVQAGTTTANGSGVWTYPSSTLIDGSYTVSATATRNGQTSTASSPFSLVIDTLNPNAPVISALQNPSASASHTITGTAEPNASVAVFVDGVLHTTVAANGSGSWSLPVVLLDGMRTVTAQATDLAGNVGALSTGAQILIDTIQPGQPTITNAAPLVRDASINLTGTAEPNATVTVRDGSTVLATVTASGGGIWSYIASGLSDGAHAFTAQAADLVNNTGVVSATYAVTVDTVAPIVPTLSVPSLTNDATPLISGSGEANSTVRILLDGIVVGTAAVNAQGVWSYTPTTLMDGFHAIAVQGIDAAGNESAWSSDAYVTVDTAVLAPTVDPLATLSKLPAQTISGIAEEGATVVIMDGLTQLGTVMANKAGGWSLMTTLADGLHMISASQTDRAGNVSGPSQSVQIKIDSLAPGAPDVAVLPQFSTVNTPTITGLAEQNSTVTVYFNGTAIGTTTANGLGQWSLTAPVMQDGAYAVTADATDAAGNRGLASADRNFTIDTLDPAIPAITSISSDTGVSATDMLTRDRTLILSGTAEQGSVVEVSRDGVFIGAALAGLTGAWRLDTTGTVLNDGTYSFTALARDAAGNVSDVSPPTLVTVDTTAAEGAIGEILFGRTGTNFSGVADAGTEIAISLAGTGIVGSTAANGNGVWSFSWNGLVEASDPGMRVFSITTTDAAGNARAFADTHGVAVLSDQVEHLMIDSVPLTIVGFSEKGGDTIDLSRILAAGDLDIDHIRLEGLADDRLDLKVNGTTVAVLQNASSISGLLNGDNLADPVSSHHLERVAEQWISSGTIRGAGVD